MSHTNVNFVALYERKPMEASSSSSIPMVDSFCRTNWDHPMISPNLDFCNVNDLHNASTNSNTTGIRSSDMGWAPSSSMLKGNMFVPSGPGLISQGLSQFPADSGFIERAARFSCFGRGNFSDLINPYGGLDGADLYAKGTSTTTMQDVFAGNDLKSISGEKSPKNDVNERKSNSLGQSRDKAKEGGIVTGNESDEAEFSGGGSVGVESSSSKALGSKKRKREYQSIKLRENEDDLQPADDITKNNTEAEPKGDQKPTLTSKSNGKQGKQGSQASDSPKEEYIHVRARRGQATNSHSLAERVRREKISERMKFLQDLVPGCSKVTGKAVMLDEIINYVQSLQRQVEFLSMKLATVNPILDLDLESVLTKDILQPRAGPSSSLGYSPDVSTMPFRQISQPGLIQPSLPGAATSFDPLGRSISSQLIAMSEGYNPAQVPNMWVEDELHNVVQISSAPLDIAQDLNGSLSKSHMKVEL